MNVPDLTSENPCPERKDLFRTLPPITLYHGTLSLILDYLPKTDWKMLSVPRLLLREIVPIWGDGGCLDAVSTTSEKRAAIVYADVGYDETKRFNADAEIAFAEENLGFQYEKCAPTTLLNRAKRIKAFRVYRGLWLKAIGKEKREELIRQLNQSYPIVFGFDSENIGDYVPISNDVEVELGIYAQIDLKKANLRYIGVPKNHLAETVRKLAKHTSLEATFKEEIDNSLDFFK